MIQPRGNFKSDQENFNSILLLVHHGSVQGWHGVVLLEWFYFGLLKSHHCQATVLMILWVCGLYHSNLISDTFSFFVSVPSQLYGGVYAERPSNSGSQQ